MDYCDNAYKKYYILTHITRHFQAIYFGSTLEELLIEYRHKNGPITRLTRTD